jgi:hypothetical protein
MAAVGHHSEALIISYCTDIEGNLSFFEAFVRETSSLSFGESGELQLADGHGFVFGGGQFNSMTR